VEVNTLLTYRDRIVKSTVNIWQNQLKDPTRGVVGGHSPLSLSLSLWRHASKRAPLKRWEARIVRLAWAFFPGREDALREAVVKEV